MSDNNFYVVKKGRKIGIFTSWNECKEQVHEYPNPIFRKFNNIEMAKKFLENPINSKNDLNQKSQNLSNKNNIIKINFDLSSIISNTFDINNDYQPEKWNTYDNEFYIFTDGSSRNLSNGTTKSGIAVFFGLSNNNIKEILTDVTNNQCELMAINYACKIIIKYFNYLVHYNKSINIVSDSEYSIKSVSQWIKTWKNNDWKTKNGLEVKNKDIISSIDNALIRVEKLNNKVNNPINIKFIHVNSHQNLNTISNMNTRDKFLWKGNYIVDLLAQDKI